MSGARRASAVAREISGEEQLSGILHPQEHRRPLRAGRFLDAAAGSWSCSETDGPPRGSCGPVKKLIKNWSLTLVFIFDVWHCLNTTPTYKTLLLFWTSCTGLFVRHLFSSCVVTLRALPAATAFGSATPSTSPPPLLLWNSLRNIRGAPGASDVSECTSSSGQPSIWLGVCCPDPEPAAPGVSQGPA